ncbi:GGDEF domain-containing protein [bacterium]|nr:GGDEF domain-containing protein [candidate division CSSED10-310 bacterium]
MGNQDQFAVEEIRISPRIKFTKFRNLLVQLARHLSDLLRSKQIGIFLRGKEPGNWALAVDSNLSDKMEGEVIHLNSDTSEILKQAIVTKQPCLLEEVVNESLFNRVKGENLLVTPMWCQGEVMGLLLSDFDAFASLSDRHLIQLNLAAELIKIGIEKEFLKLQIDRLEKELSNTESSDSQGYLFTESFVNWLIEREIERAERHGSSFALLLITLDSLPLILSEAGQKKAEQVLQEYQDSMNHLIRKCDLLIRKDGDKYLCVSLEQNIAGACVLAEKLRHKIKETEIVLNKKQLVSTVSIGIAIWPDGKRIKAEKLLDRAMFALKEAQQKGNRVKVWKS